MFFVQTKIDERSEAEWEDIRAKSQTRLKEKFGHVLADTTVWPLSSVLLQKAGAAGPYAEPRLIDSRHRAFAPALSAFLYRVVGWSRAADAVLLASESHGRGAVTLATRHRVLVDESREAAEEYRGRLTHAKRAVEEAGSAFNQGRNRALDRLRAEARHAFREIEDAVGNAEAEVRERIDAVSEGTVAALGERMAEEVVGRVSAVWEDVRGDALDLYSSLLSDLLIEAEDDLRVDDLTAHRTLPGAPKLEGDFLARLFVARNHAATAGWAAGGAGAMLVAVGVVALPLAALGAAAAAIWGLVSGWRSSGRAAAQAARGRLLQHLGEVGRAVRTNYHRAAEDLFSALETSMREQTDRYAAGKRAAAEGELARLQDEDRMTNRQCADEAKKIEGQAAEWRKLGDDLAAARGQLDRLADAVTRRSGGPTP